MVRSYFFKHVTYRRSVTAIAAATMWLVVSSAHAEGWGHRQDVVTISGSPAVSVITGQPYSFTPSATDTSGRTLVFAITNKPSWATFSSSTGQLSGTPTASSVGTYSNLVIAVSDGWKSATLPPFAVQVLASASSSPSSPPPTISGTPPTSDIAGTAYSFQPTASGPSGTTLTFSVQNKPAWANFSIATGLLSGTPSGTQTGTYSNIVLSVSDGVSSSSLAPFGITVNAATPANPAVSLSASPATVTAGAGSTLTWSSTNATSCSASGGWSGSEPASGSTSTGALSVTTTYTLTCSGASGTTPATQTATVTVQSLAGSLSITSPATLPNATNGGGYFYLLQASGGTPPYLWALSSKTGATNWVVTPGGWLEGAPTTNESDSIVVTVTDSASHSAQGTFTVSVNSNLAVMNQNFVVGGISLPPAVAGAPYRHALQAAGGSSPYSWNIASGSLPPGLTLSSAGVITGTPTASGNAAGIVFQVTDGTNATATANASITVTAANKVARPSYNTGNGFFVLNGQLYDPNGNLFRIRGVNRTHYDSNSSQGILRAQPNTVRYTMWQINTAPTTPNAGTYENGAYTQHIANGQFVIIADFMSTPAAGNIYTSGNTDPTILADVVSWWVANEPTFAPIMNQIAINIANEWGPANSSVWATAYQSAIAQLRAAGYTCPLVIDSGFWGQDPYDFLNYAQQVFNSDPQKNVIFSLHIYGHFYDSAAGVAALYSSQADLQPTTNSLAALGVPIIYGEFGPGRNIGPSPTLVTPARVIQAAEGANFGWMGWAWDDNNLANCGANDNSFSMVYSCGKYSVPSDLTEYGLDMTLNPAYGWDALASPAPVFLQ